MHQASSHQLNRKDDLVAWTVSRVGDVTREREHQWNEGDIFTRRCYFAHADRYGDVIKSEAAVHEERADHHQFSSEIRVRYHDLAITVVPSVLPVPFDSFHAFVDVSLVDDQRVIFHERHHAEYQRAELFQFAVGVLDFEHDEQAARYKEETDQTVTDDVYEPVYVLFES